MIEAGFRLDLKAVVILLCLRLVSQQNTKGVAEGGNQPRLQVKAVMILPLLFLPSAAESYMCITCAWLQKDCIAKHECPCVSQEVVVSMLPVVFFRQASFNQAAAGTLIWSLSFVQDAYNNLESAMSTKLEEAQSRKRVAEVARSALFTTSSHHELQVIESSRA